MMRRGAAYGLATVILGMALAGPAAAQYPPTTGTGRVSASTVAPGGCVTFSGDGFAPSSDVAVTDNTKDVRTVESSLTGSFSTSVCPTVLGVHLIQGTGTDPTGAARTVSAEVTVLPALSTTGADNVLPTVGAGAALVALGSAIVFLARRRRVVRFS